MEEMKLETQKTKPRSRKSLAEELVPELENWLRQCRFWNGDVSIEADFPNGAIGFAVEIGSPASAVVQAQGFPERWGDFPVRFWSENYPKGVKGVKP